VCHCSAREVYGRTDTRSVAEFRDDHDEVIFSSLSAADTSTDNLINLYEVDASFILFVLFHCFIYFVDTHMECVRSRVNVSDGSGTDLVCKFRYLG